jgi:transposase
VCNCNRDRNPRQRYPSSLSDNARAVIEPLLPVRDLRKGGAARKYGDRLALDGIFFVLRPGCQWRMIPRDLLPWDAAYRWYRTWAKDGTWDQIHDALRAMARNDDGRDPCPSAAVLDARSIKSSEGGQARDMGKKTTGRKRHLVVDTLGLLLVVMVTSASVQDRNDPSHDQPPRRRASPLEQPHYVSHRLPNSL